MATYTVVSTTLLCTGTDITSAGILSALNSNGLGSGHFGQTAGNKDTYYFNASIQIGDAGSSGSSSIWNCSNEIIKINATLFYIYGTVQMGSYPSSISTDGGSFVVTGTSADTFRLFSNGIFRAYGSFVYAQSRIRVNDDTEFTVIDCDVELEDSVGVGDEVGAYGARQQITYDRTRVHHTGAVGIKLYSYNSGSSAASYSLAGTKVEKCTYAFQLGSSVNLTPILKDVQIDTCTYHTVPNLGDANVIFINPDFTVLRAVGSTNNDITTIAFRYNFKVQNSSSVAIQNAKVYIVDQHNDIVVNSESTDASGLINSYLFDYDGDVCLKNSTFASNTKTDRANHARSVYKYGFLAKTDTVTVNQDTKDFVGLLLNLSITESNKATVDAYTEIDTSAMVYDRASSYLEDNFGTELSLLIGKSGSQVDFDGGSATAIIVDSSAVSAFAYSGTTITVDSNTFTGGAIGTGTVTIQGATIIQNARYDCDVNYQTSATTLTNITCTGILDFDTAGTYTLDACDISEVTNSSGSAITLLLSNGSTITTNTGPDIVLVNAVTIRVKAVDIAGVPIVGARVYLEAGAGGDLAQGTEILNATTNASGIVEDIAFNYTSDQPLQNSKVRKGTTSPIYKPSPILGTIGSTGFDVTVTVVSDE